MAFFICIDILLRFLIKEVMTRVSYLNIREIGNIWLYLERGYKIFGLLFFIYSLRDLDIHTIYVLIRFTLSLLVWVYFLYKDQ